MIRHIVMWKLKDSALGLDKPALAAEMKRRLEALPGLVPECFFPFRPPRGPSRARLEV